MNKKIKIQVRHGVFETNSSSEHSIALINLNQFNQWKRGEILARVVSIQNDDGCWGNFWSEMLSFEFTDDFEKAEFDNKKTVKRLIDERTRFNEEYKQRCLSYKPKLERELTREEIDKLSREELDKYRDDLYEDVIHKFDENSYNYHKNLCENLSMENFDMHFDRTESGMWMTFDEFWNSWIEHNDCYSPFEHDDLINNMHIIGKYYHS